MQLPMQTIVSRYENQSIIYTGDGTAMQLVLPADSQRFFVRFEASGFAAFTSPLFPGPVPDPLPVGSQAVLPVEYRFRDCPSIVTGEFYCGVGGGTEIVIFTSRFIG